MAKFEMELPNNLIKDFEKLEVNTSKMLGEMTQAGAEVVKKLVEKNVPESFKDSKIMDCLQVTKTYKTPTDGGVNTKVAFYGYFENDLGKTVPAPLVANVFEYGSSKVDKKPFMRKSFKKAEITNAMEKVQEKYLPKE